MTLLILGAGAWWMYSDREGRLDDPRKGPSAGNGDVERKPAAPPPAFALRDSERVLAVLPDDARDVLEQAEVFELLALHPEHDAAEGVPAEQLFHRWHVLGRTRIDGATERRTLIEELYRSLDGNPGEAASCFIPRHALRAVRGDREVGVVICFECLQCLVHGVKAEGTVTGYLLEESERVYDAALKRHGLKKHPRK